MSTIYHSVARWSSRACGHVQHRGFSPSEAKDAVQEALLDLGEKLKTPDFEPPRDPRAYPYVHALGKAREARRKDKRLQFATDEGDGFGDCSADALVLHGLGDSSAGLPDRQLTEQEEAAAFVKWLRRVVNFILAIAPADRAVLTRNEERCMRKERATPQERQELCRVRFRLRKLARRFGLFSPRRP